MTKQPDNLPVKIPLGNAPGCDHNSLVHLTPHNRGIARTNEFPELPNSAIRRYTRSNRYRGLCACGDHAWAVLTKGFVTFVSPEDARLLQERKWHATPRRHTVYVEADGGQGCTVLLHRVIIGDAARDEVDHANRNALDNQRNNLRPCSSSQNQGNGGHRPGKSGFRGVYRHKRGVTWIARIGKRKKPLGTFATPDEAARAYDAAAIERFGEFATLNFPREAPR